MIVNRLPHYDVKGVDIYDNIHEIGIHGRRASRHAYSSYSNCISTKLMQMKLKTGNIHFGISGGHYIRPKFSMDVKNLCLDSFDPRNLCDNDRILNQAIIMIPVIERSKNRRHVFETDKIYNPHNLPMNKKSKRGYRTYLFQKSVDELLDLCKCDPKTRHSIISENIRLMVDQRSTIYEGIPAKLVPYKLNRLSKVDYWCPVETLLKIIPKKQRSPLIFRIILIVQHMIYGVKITMVAQTYPGYPYFCSCSKTYDRQYVEKHFEVVNGPIYKNRNASLICSLLRGKMPLLNTKVCWRWLIYNIRKKYGTNYCKFALKDRRSLFHRICCLPNEILEVIIDYLDTQEFKQAYPIFESVYKLVGDRLERHRFGSYCKYKYNNRYNNN